jgi:hypothetical protein
MPTRITIENLYKTEGLNIEGVNIDEWITSPDAYEFLVYADGHKWMFKLCRNSNDVTLAGETESKPRYKLELHATGTQCYTSYLGINEIKIKRLFYKSVKRLVNDHIDFVTKEILSKAFSATSHSINI